MEASNAVEGMKITDRNLPAVCEGFIYGKMCCRSFKCSNKDPSTKKHWKLDINSAHEKKSTNNLLGVKWLI